MDDSRILGVARLGAVDYAAALELQQAIVAARMRGAIGDLLLLLEHPRVFTLGRGADERFLTRRLAGVPIHRVSRGGQVTYHGPGQLVGYPIIRLDGAERDVTRYLRKLEAVIIAALARLEIAAGRRAGLTGVWAGARKIASIGVGIRRWTTLHGFALNVATDLAYFDAIVPCGIAGCQMTSVAREGRPEVSVDRMAELIAPAFADQFGYAALQPISADRLWALLESAAHGCEARSGSEVNDDG